MSSAPVFSGVRVARSLVLFVMFSRSCLAIVLSVLRSTVSAETIINDGFSNSENV